MAQKQLILGAFFLYQQIILERMTSEALDAVSAMAKSVDFVCVVIQTSFKRIMKVFLRWETKKLTIDTFKMF